ncbi:hypothetical protein Lalb_Chr10g0099541 [Lupinus albus]|uniref:Uncharacterized protein n=1 Tax=Lupinus albus TaxID=3870 RepID=A0A6A4PWH4_LUPAL|nr:hypothetical protein Lalb_Chr10g0099541 [Lupinus albus]
MAKITGEKTKMGSSRWGFTSVFFSGLLLRSSSIELLFRAMGFRIPRPISYSSEPLFRTVSNSCLFRRVHVTWD